MKQPVVVDIETKNSFNDVGSYDSKELDVSLVGLYDYATDSYKSFLEDELDRLWPFLEKSSYIIGFNSIYFDIPILNKYYVGDLNAFPQCDLLKELRDVWGKSAKLDAIAKGTLGVGKTGDGLKAITLYKEGKLKELADYCLDDVRITKDIYEFIKKEKKIIIETVTGFKEVKMKLAEPVGVDQKRNSTLPL
jgi:DEAD/DEAH box helicase domain-containing protein